jgi:hypothetical protein
VTVIDRYLPLSDTEQQEFRQMIQREEMREAQTMITTYEEQGRLIGKKDAALRIARRRFGAEAERLVPRIEAVTAEADADALIDRLLTAASVEEVETEGG